MQTRRNCHFPTEAFGRQIIRTAIAVCDEHGEGHQRQVTTVAGVAYSQGAMTAHSGIWENMENARFKELFKRTRLVVGDEMPIQNTAIDASRLFADPVS